MERKKGVIQNEEVLFEALFGGEFFIQCLDKKDAHSKCVSLFNARNNKMSPSQQRRIRIQRVQEDGVWGVKVSKAPPTTIYEIIDGKMIPWTPKEQPDPVEQAPILKDHFAPQGRISDESRRILELMLRDGKDSLEVLDVLSKEREDDVLEEIALWKEKNIERLG